MTTSTSSVPTSNERLVDALATRLRYADLIGWTRITARAEELGLSFEDLRLLLALTSRSSPSSVSDLARISGLSLDAAYPTVHHLRGRGYGREERRQYSLSEDGRELVAVLDAAHREGIQAYVDQGARRAIEIPGGSHAIAALSRGHGRRDPAGRDRCPRPPDRARSPRPRRSCADAIHGTDRAGCRARRGFDAHANRQEASW